MRNRKIKNAILKSMAWAMGLIFLISACAIDSPSWVPTILCVVSAAWLALFAYANGMIEVYFEEDEQE